MLPKGSPLAQVSELTGGQRVEAEVLAALVAELRRRREAQFVSGASDQAASAASANGEAANAVAQGNGLGAQQNGNGERWSPPPHRSAVRSDRAFDRHHL